MIALQGAIFDLQFEIAFKLQNIEYQEKRLIAYRNALVKHMCEKVRGDTEGSFCSPPAFKIRRFIFRRGKLSETYF